MKIQIDLPDELVVQRDAPFQHADDAVGDPHRAGHRRRAGAGRFRPGRQSRRSGQRAQVCRRLCTMACHHRRAEVATGAGGQEQHHHHRGRDQGGRALITPTALPPRPPSQRC